jgi:ZIP family zinc transporter
MILSAIAAFTGYAVFRQYSPQVIAATTAAAAGGILAMLSSTLIPEAYEEARDLIGVITVIGGTIRQYLGQLCSFHSFNGTVFMIRCCQPHIFIVELR